MAATHQDVNASPSIPQAIEQGLEKKSLPTIVGAELEQVATNLVKKALSNPATWPGGPPASPVRFSSMSPLDTSELESHLANAITGSEADSTDIEDTLGFFKPAQSSSVSNEQEGVPVASGTDLKHPTCTTPDDFKLFKKRTTTPSFKTVVEIWDKETCKYKIAEPVETTSSGQDDYAEYAFVVRERVDRKSEEVMPYIDIKSESLRNILREVLHGIKALSLMENKPSIEQNVLFHFLPELDKYAESMSNSPDCEFPHQHLRLLIDHLKHTYATTSQRLNSMIQHGHITYGLLWALFKPGSHVYSKCFGTCEPRCVIFDAGEETTEDNVTYYKLECRYVDYDGQKFSEAGIFLGVTKFRGSKPIEALQVFPLRHHPDCDRVRKDLVKRGQKFRDLAGTHIQHCDGSAFFMKNGTPVEVKINSQVGVDAEFFRQMLPNYSRPRL